MQPGVLVLSFLQKTAALALVGVLVKILYFYARRRLTLHPTSGQRFIILTEVKNLNVCWVKTFRLG